ncbi:hypothetical protein MKX03_020372 [Papaver bracteatum]|nr:hypothetical protein MKX03_020372 [Papaver bracteatum]
MKKQKRLSEAHEIELLESWINSGKPDSGSIPSSAKLPSKSPVIGKTGEKTIFPSYAAGCTEFKQLPMSKKTIDGLTKAKYKEMTDIQRASLPHSLCGRDILGAAKTGSGKTLAFILPILEKLYRLRWSPEDGVGGIILTPTRELADQIFEVLTEVGKHHGFSAGLLIGGRKDVGAEKELVNELNILVCTPGRLLQHMDETPNFDCSQLQVLVLDEADRILDEKFKKEVTYIISQLPKQRQTLLFSATQTKSVKDLDRLNLKDPEYIDVHEEDKDATPSLLQQTAIIVPLHQKLDMLWSFIKAHLKSKILVFLSTCKQVKFVFEVFKKLQPGIPLKSLHGRMKLKKRMMIYSQFCESETCSVLFSTDVSSRGLDFKKQPVDWVVQVDCPDDEKSYIHRVGRTARNFSVGRSVLYLDPSEEQMVKKLRSKKESTKTFQSLSGLLAALLVKYPNLQLLAQRAFITYVRSIHKQRDREVFDVTKVPIEEFSASLGLPMTPKLRFLNKKTISKPLLEVVAPQEENATSDDVSMLLKLKNFNKSQTVGEVENDQEIQMDGGNEATNKNTVPVARVPKKKKLKIDPHRPFGTRLVIDEGDLLPPLATMCKRDNGSIKLDRESIKAFRASQLEDMKKRDKDDKVLQKKRLQEKRTKQEEKEKRGRDEKEDIVLTSGSEREEAGVRSNKKLKTYFDSSSKDVGRAKGDNLEINSDSVSLAEQEAIALKLLSSMHS